MRLEKIDICRGIAIFLMVLVHSNYFLITFVETDIIQSPNIFWIILGKISAMLFIFIAGLSFFLAEKKYGDAIVSKYTHVILTLTFIALGITLGSYLLAPDIYVRFGIIHFFALSFFLLLYLRKLKKYILLIAGGVLIIGNIFTFTVNNPYIFFLGWIHPEYYTIDHYPLFPYFGVVLLGYAFGLYVEENNKMSILGIEGKLTKFQQFLQTLGKYSLAIYVGHILLIIGIFGLYQYITIR